MSVLIIGAGVIGLSCGIVLQRAGVRTRIVARDVAPDVTSCVAAAFWEPFKADPIERIIAWGSGSLGEFIRLADRREGGVTLRWGRSVFPRPAPDPWWRDSVPFRRLTRGQLPPGYVDGYAWTTAVIETPIYVPWLMEQYQKLGGTIEARTLSSLDEALAGHGLVINCTGLGARELVPDPAVYPSRGQLVRVEQFGLDRFTVDDEGSDGMCYIIPRSKDVILGGTVEDHVERLDPDPAAAEAILRRCAKLEPRLAKAKVVGHQVGLRPRRPAVRLEQERRGDKAVIHNYGHGGAGVTLSWGCAQEVLALARQHLRGKQL